MVGLGTVDPSSCPPDPCGLWDYIYASDACVAYENCMGYASGVLESQGLIAGTGTVVGQTVGETVANSIQSTAAGLFQNADGSTNWAMIGLSAVLAWVFLKSR